MYMSLWTPVPPSLAPPARLSDYDAGIDGPSYVRLPGPVLGAVVVAAGLGLLTANPLLTAASLLVLPLFVTLLWREGETPVLLFAVGFQWLQVTAKVFNADVLGVSVHELSFSDNVEDVIWLGLTGLVVLSLGMRFGLRSLRERFAERARVEAEVLSVDQAFKVYLGGFVLAQLAVALGEVSSVFAQLAAGLEAVRWVGFFLFAYLALRQRRKGLLLLGVIAIEFVLGLGFFAGFKTVLFVSVIAYFAARPQLRLPGLATAAVAGAVLLVLGSVWTVVKPAYRAYLSGGSMGQTVVVDQGDQLSTLLSLVTDLDGDDVVAGLEPMFERLSYVDYFAYATDYVPTVREHEGGALWARSILHVLQPRLLFPDKPSLESDSDVTARYTGLYVADEGTSISIGYMGESYIDFGRVGMFVPIFLIGTLWGFLYVYFMQRARYALVGYAFATALLTYAYQFEMAGIKLFGGVLSRFVVLALLLHFLQNTLERWLGGGDDEESAGVLGRYDEVPAAG